MCRNEREELRGAFQCRETTIVEPSRTLHPGSGTQRATLSVVFISVPVADCCCHSCYYYCAGDDMSPLADSAHRPSLLVVILGWAGVFASLGFVELLCSLLIPGDSIIAALSAAVSQSRVFDLNILSERLFQSPLQRRRTPSTKLLPVTVSPSACEAAQFWALVWPATR